jgi:uncharacterized membrane protein YagU involved in acid resistance
VQTIETIALSAAVAGVLDLGAAVLLARVQGIPISRPLRFIASAVMGKDAFERGVGIAAIGLALHFLIATIWAALYFIIASQLAVLRSHPFLCGAAYGVVVHLVMSRVIVPLSRAPTRPFAWKAWLVQLGVHICCVGLPISWIQSWRVS